MIIERFEFTELLLSWLYLIGEPAKIDDALIEQLLDSNNELRLSASDAANLFLTDNRQHLISMHSQYADNEMTFEEWYNVS